MQTASTKRKGGKMEEEKNLIPLVLYFSKEGINGIIVVSFATGLCTLLGRVPAGERKREGAAALT